LPRGPVLLIGGGALASSLTLGKTGGNMNTKLALLIIPLLAACSTGQGVMPANSITASALDYHHWTCQQLADEQMRLSIAMTLASPESGAGRSDNNMRNTIVEMMDSKRCGAPRPIIASVG
jgi:hypothetical protein